MSDSDKEHEHEPESKPIPSEVQKEIANLVKDWIRADDELKLVKDKAKEYNDIKKEKEDLILGAIETYNLPKIQVTNGILRKSVSMTKVGLKPEMVLQSVKDIVKKDADANTITSHIFENRPNKERIYLKRTSYRQKKDTKDDN
jgi:hypothetical protein